MLSPAGAATVDRQPVRQPVRLHLAASRIETGLTLVVAAPERNAAADGFQVNAPPAAGAVVYQQSRMPPQQFVPEFVVAFDVANLSHTLTIRRIRRAPIRQRIKVEILAVAVNAHLPDHVRDEIRQEAPRFRVA